MFTILSEHFLRRLQTYLLDINNIKQTDLLTFLERHTSDITSCLDCLLNEFVVVPATREEQPHPMQ